MRLHWFVGGLAAFALLAAAQDTVSSTANNGRVVSGSMGFAGQRFMGTPVTGAPYSAQRSSERVQTGADGTRFTQQNQQETIYRDSQGRTRTERQMGPGKIAGSPTVIEIQDSVAGVSYTLDPQNKVAHRVTLLTPDMHPTMQRAGTGIAAERSGTLGATVPPPAVAASRTQPERKNEDLGQQVMEGVAVVGHRMTQIWPAGSQGNDRPFQVVTETWFSPELKETVLVTNSDPRTGENTTKLTNISRAEPDASLFLPPADYQVVEETGPFQTHWTATMK